MEADMGGTKRAVAGFVAGKWLEEGGAAAGLLDKYTGEVIAEVAATDRSQVSEAVVALQESQRWMILPPRQRADILLRAAELVRARRSELTRTVQADTGFALGDAVKEVDRTAETLTLCAEEAKRLVGHMVPIQGAPNSPGRISYAKCEPYGLVCALTPFNSPLNTVAHKVAPAIAAGNSVLLKPASLTPLSAQAFVQLLLDAGLPPEKIGLVYGPGAQVGRWLAEEPAIAYYAFTGSTAAGEQLHRSVGMRRTQLEMGSLASTFVCRDADVESAAKAIVGGALRKSGQVCTSVQRVYVDEVIREDLVRLVAAGMTKEVAGDPGEPETTVGPLIARAEACRVEEWIAEAVRLGGELVCGGTRKGSVVEPAVLIDVPDSARIVTSELFGPAVVIRSFRDLGQALEEANSTPYGLAAGIFTNSLDLSFQAIDALDVGNLYINQTSSSRADLMPFGGFKLSGFGGSEGPAYAVRDMSREKTVTWALP
ncbi:MAG: aldehyde dehydrogenase family protein [Arthrobacter sp.]